MVLLHAFLMLKGFSYSLEEGGELHAQKKENHTVLKRHENVNSWINFFFFKTENDSYEICIHIQLGLGCCM